MAYGFKEVQFQGRVITGFFNASGEMSGSNQNLSPAPKDLHRGPLIDSDGVIFDDEILITMPRVDHRTGGKGIVLDDFGNRIVLGFRFLTPEEKKAYNDSRSTMPSHSSSGNAGTRKPTSSVQAQQLDFLARELIDKGLLEQLSEKAQGIAKSYVIKTKAETLLDQLDDEDLVLSDAQKAALMAKLGLK